MLAQAFERQLGPRRRAGARRRAPEPPPVARPARRRPRAELDASCCRARRLHATATTSSATGSTSSPTTPSACATHRRRVDLLDALGRRGRSAAELQGRRTRPGAELAGHRAVASRRIRRRGERSIAAVRAEVRPRVRRIGHGHPRASRCDARRRAAGAGQLEFHDLLVLARSLLRDPEHGAAVRARLHERYQRLLLDEFQDTDPIQIELAVRIAAADPESTRPGTAPWDEVAGRARPPVLRRRPEAVDLPVPAGRHRHVPRGRATASAPTAAASVELTTNFRTVAPVIDWVNARLRRR